MCKKLKTSSCGNLAFCGFIPALTASDASCENTVPDSESNQSRSEEVIATCATDEWTAVAYETGVSCYATRQFSGEACPNKFSTWFQRVTEGRPAFLALKSLKQSSREERSGQLIIACVSDKWELLIWKQFVDLDSVQSSPVQFVGKTVRQKLQIFTRVSLN